MLERYQSIFLTVSLTIFSSNFRTKLGHLFEFTYSSELYKLVYTIAIFLQAL